MVVSACKGCLCSVTVVYSDGGLCHKHIKVVCQRTLVDIESHVDILQRSLFGP